MVMDAFSRLADDVVIHILSFLSTEEAAATGILSRRWRNLWKLTRRLHVSINSSGSVFSFVEASRVRLVYSLIFSFDPDSLPIHEFCVQCSNCGTDIARDVERWISLALHHHNLQTLTLALNLLYDKYRFPDPIPSSSSNGAQYNLVHLQLGSCKRLPRFDHFPNLRTIILWKCLVTDDDFESIKFNCTFLEVLALKQVRGLINLTISSTDLYHLRHLEIVCRSLQTLSIQSPNLAVLVYHWETPVEHIFAPRLRQVCLMGRKTLSSALSLFQETTIHKLTLELTPGPDQNFDHSRPCTLNHVKHLSLRVTNQDLTGLDVLLRASSSLESLTLYLFKVKSTLQLPLRSNDHWKHENLQRIHIHGFCWTQCHLQIVKFLVEVVVVLKEIIITPLKVGHHFHHDYDGLIRVIAHKLSQGLRLVILPARAMEST